MSDNKNTNNNNKTTRDAPSNVNSSDATSTEPVPNEVEADIDTTKQNVTAQNETAQDDNEKSGTELNNIESNIIEPINQPPKNDKITSVTAKTDRAGLNIEEARKSKRTAAKVAAALLCSVVIIGFGSLALDALPKGNEDKDNTIAPVHPTNTPPQPDHAAGEQKSRLADTPAVFAKLSADKKVRDDLNPPNDTTEQPPPTIPNVTKINTNKPSQPTPKAPVVIKRSGVDSDNTKTPAQLAQEQALAIETRKLNPDVMVKTSQTSAPMQQANVNESLTTPTFANGVAFKRNAGALDFLLIHGTAIPCALVTQVISDYEGLVRCQVTQDVYSSNGSALLIERGSSVSGTQNVAMEQGKSRVFTNWSSIETPLGISIRIDSLGVGALGATGNEAWVDNHFSQRFGGAILLSFVDDALGTLSAKASDKGDVQFDNSTNNASNMAEKALDSSINIAPTGYAYIGQRINILVARDIDMSSVYQFAPL